MRRIVGQLAKKQLSKEDEALKDGYRFFMEKEIHEQSKIVSDILSEKVKDGKIYLDELDEDLFNGIDEIVICACGTSYHAGLAASYLFERIANIRTKVEPASEYRYKKPFINKNSLFIAISQSGETADTLSALKVAKECGLKTLVICNVEDSSMVKLGDNVILTNAGVERSVASTKVFTTQVLFLWMIVLYLANLRNTVSNDQLKAEMNALLKVPSLLQIPDALQQKIRVITKHYMHGHGFFFIGRDVFYPLALEGALKLKEVSYLHAEGYASGEMRHGPIALVDERLYTVALLPKNKLYDETRANVDEIISRDGHVFVISPKEFSLSDDFIKTSEQDHYMCEFFEMLVILQFFSLEISIRRGNDIDSPRNLVKSVAD